MVYLLLLVLLSFADGFTPTAEDLSQSPPLMRRVYRRQTPALLRHVSTGTRVVAGSSSPLVEQWFPPGLEPPSEPVRELLLPVWPNISPPSASGVTVRTSCEDDKMQLQVERSITGPEGPDSLLRLGTCQSSKSTEKYLYFDYDLGMCGTKHTVIGNQVIYFNMLHYNPPKPRGPIRRALPFSLPVACYSNRYLFSYKVGFTPKVQIHQLSKEMKNSFILTPRNAWWEKLSPSDHYTLWEPMYFEAEAPALSHHERLYVHTCHVSPGKSPTSTPQFQVVKNFGCAVDNKDGRSRFIPYRNDAVRFSVEASSFKGMEGQQLHMHCSVSVGSLVPTPTAKSCNYDTQAKKWLELFGSDSVCGCCDSICGYDVPPATLMVSSGSWTIEAKMKPITSLKRKGVPSTVTAAPEMKGWKWKWGPEKMMETLVGNKVREMEWPFGGGAVTWVEGDGDERLVEGSAVVEAEEESVAEPRRIFEDIFVFDK